MASAAVTTLGKVIVDPGAPPASKVRAADSILNHTAKAIELEDIEARLAALELGVDEDGQASPTAGAHTLGARCLGRPGGLAGVNSLTPSRKYFVLFSEQPLFQMRLSVVFQRWTFSHGMVGSQVSRDENAIQRVTA
jgi:hypothetical protein